MATRVGQLEISVITDIAKIKSDVDQLKRMHQEAAASVGEAWSSIKDVLGMAGITLGVRELMTQFLNLANEMHQVAEAAQMVGVTVEQYETFGYALKLAGGNAEKAQTALGMLDRMLSQAASGSQTAQEKFHALNIEYVDANGAVRDAYSVMRDLADVFASHADGAAKTAWAMALFGRSGRELIPILDQGSQGLDAMDKRLGDLGAKMTGEELRNVTAFRTAWTDMKEAWHGAAMQLENELLPWMTRLAEKMAQLAQARQTIALGGASVPAGSAGTAIALGGAPLGIGGGQWLPPQPPSTQELLQQWYGKNSYTLDNPPTQQMRPPPSETGGDQKTELDSLIATLEREVVTVLDGKEAWTEYQLAAAIATDKDKGKAEQARELINLLSIQTGQHKYQLEVDANMAAQADYKKKQDRELLEIQRETVRWDREEADAVAALDTTYAGGRERGRAELEAQLDAEYARAAIGKEGEALQQLAQKWMDHRNRLMGIYDQETQNQRSWSTGWQKAFEQFKDSADDNCAHAKQIFGDMTRSMSDAMVNFVHTGKLDFSDLANSIIDDLIRIYVEKQITGFLGNLSSLGSLGGIFGEFGLNLGGGTVAAGAAAPPGVYASGGDVAAFRPAIVGEQGPELFVPRTAGTIVPAGAARQMLGGPTVQVFNNYQIDSRTDQAAIVQAIQDGGRATEARIYESIRRRGPMSVH